MNIEQIREYCISKTAVTESFPFDEETLVFKVAGKMFALLNINPPLSINLKCNPDNAIELREQYDFVLPGYHMNKTHWNTIKLEAFIPEKLLKDWIDQSYNIVIGKLPASTRRTEGLL